MYGDDGLKQRLFDIIYLCNDLLKQPKAQEWWEENIAKLSEKAVKVKEACLKADELPDGFDDLDGESLPDELMNHRGAGGRRGGGEAKEGDEAPASGRCGCE